MRTITETNAGPMADIAFLLLVFFLVATTMNAEKGISRKMPSTEVSGSKPHPKRNTLLVLVNAQDKVMVNQEIVTLPELNNAIVEFVNNNGKGECDYCVGSKSLENSSDHPTQALIGLDVQKGTSYAAYVKVQNEISAAYHQMRDTYAQTHYGGYYDNLPSKQQKEVRTKLPLLLSEQVMSLN